MMILVSGATLTKAGIDDSRLGTLCVPADGNRLDDRPWACDNGAFGSFDARAFERMLVRLRHSSGCLWVAVPDVVGDAAATLRSFRYWRPRIAEMGFPIAFVLQDGCTDPPWDDLDAVFVGGSTAYKLSRHAARIVGEARGRGKRSHMGRVNTIRRLRYAAELRVDTVDGSCFSRWPRIKIPWALAAIDRFERQTWLPEVDA